MRMMHQIYVVKSDFGTASKGCFHGFVASFDLWPWWICGLIGFEALLDLWLQKLMASVDLSFATVCGLTNLGFSAFLSLQNMWPGWMCALSFGLPCWIQAMAGFG